MNENDLIDLITKRVLNELCASCGFCADKSCLAVRECDVVASNHRVPVGISARHVHVSQPDLEALFGEGAKLTPHVDLYQPGEFAAKELVTLVGPKRAIEGVRILGPTRKYTQAEIARTDAIRMGIHTPIRDSGDLADAAPITIVGPKGSIFLPHGAITAARHIHMSFHDAEAMGLKPDDRVKIRVGGDRPLIYENVKLKLGKNLRLQLHLDTDEGNAAGLSGGEAVDIITPHGQVVDLSEVPPRETPTPSGETVARFEPDSPNGKPIVTASSISALAPQVRTLIVPNPVILTPLARDAAREREIRIVTTENEILV